MKSALHLHRHGRAAQHGATLVVGMIYLALNLMADMLYRLLDPRVAA